MVSSRREIADHLGDRLPVCRELPVEPDGLLPKAREGGRCAPGSGAADGSPSSHPWEAALKELERAVRETPELPAPLPRWLHRDFRDQQNDVAQREQQRRRLRSQKEAA